MPVILIMVVILFVLAILPLKISRQNSATIKATVSKVSEGGLKDIVVSLDDIRGVYYISHFSKKGLKASDLNNRLANKEVAISYSKPRFLSLLNPMTNTIQINELKLGHEVIFSEFK
jgi:hypothetical protein